ncbi:hypothetical protein ACEN2J_11765 [Pseudorhodobacter sp. W20_MBD10_FR17]|uniref:hypothetical protein n=1 Tax=Pseudorhodobacter sp. W20_MBD10_FR17 TaxID=3240266 RepID=UPI003F9925A9
MSEPMSTVDIEDVLASIRKLVSEDLRPVAPQAASAHPVVQGGVAGGKGKLLLTPALRVVSDQVADMPESQDAPEAPYEFVENDGFGMSGQVIQVHPAQSRTDVTEEPSFADSGAELPPEAAQAHEEDWLPENNEEAEPFPGWAPTSAQATSDVTRVVNEIAAGVSDADEDWEPETGDSLADAWQAPDWRDEEEVAKADALTQYAAKAIGDRAEAAAVAEVLALDAMVAPETVTETSEDSEPELRFDEAVLRDLVRDLINQELSGPLGERITRNIRKLVRAEINRAMTAKSLD